MCAYYEAGTEFLNTETLFYAIAEFLKMWAWNENGVIKKNVITVKKNISVNWNKRGKER